MKRFGVICLCIVLLAVTVSGQVPLNCGTSTTQCSALTSLRIFVSGLGSCSGFARADCFAFASSTGVCIDDIFVKIRQDQCRQKDIAIFAKCFARAVARVFASAFVQIQCSGGGRGCGFSQANGQAWACAIASVFAELLVDVGGGQARCEVGVGAFAAVFAEAAANAQAFACVKGNDFEKDFESDFALRVESILAKAVARCFVFCSDRSATAVASGDVSVTQSPSPVAIGDTDGGVIGG